MEREWENSSYCGNHFHCKRDRARVHTREQEIKGEERKREEQRREGNKEREKFPPPSQ